MIRSLATTLGEIAGVACIVYGLWQLAPWMGWVALGIGLVLISMLADTPSRSLKEVRQPAFRPGEPLPDEDPVNPVTDIGVAS